MELIFVNPPQIASDERDTSYWQRKSLLSPEGQQTAELLRARLAAHNFNFVAYPGTLNYAYDTARIICGDAQGHVPNAMSSGALDPDKGDDDLDFVGKAARNWNLWQIDNEFPGYLHLKGYEIAAAIIHLMKVCKHKGLGLIILPEPYLSMTLWALDRKKEGIPTHKLVRPGHGFSVEVYVSKESGFEIGQIHEFGPTVTRKP